MERTHPWPRPTPTPTDHRRRGSLQLNCNSLHRRQRCPDVAHTLKVVEVPVPRPRDRREPGIQLLNHGLPHVFKGAPERHGAVLVPQPRPSRVGDRDGAIDRHGHEPHRGLDVKLPRRHRRVQQLGVGLVRRQRRPVACDPWAGRPCLLHQRLGVGQLGDDCGGGIVGHARPDHGGHLLEGPEGVGQGQRHPVGPAGPERRHLENAVEQLLGVEVVEQQVRREDLWQQRPHHRHDSVDVPPVAIVHVLLRLGAHVPSARLDPPRHRGRRDGGEGTQLGGCLFLLARHLLLLGAGADLHLGVERGHPGREPFELGPVRSDCGGVLVCRTGLVGLVVGVGGPDEFPNLLLDPRAHHALELKHPSPENVTEHVVSQRKLYRHGCSQCPHRAHSDLRCLRRGTHGMSRCPTRPSMPSGSQDGVAHPPVAR
eukprot:m.336955 g.336955  ORF g.336955 m.336955 type:complete len:426 (-) comp27789_c0_seq9:79-1356(-)